MCEGTDVLVVEAFKDYKDLTGRIVVQEWKRFPTPTAQLLV